MNLVNTIVLVNMKIKKTWLMSFILIFNK